ncbi:MAG: hypothetical protein QGH60_12940 [Phycisphaerae bacterium]|jgi:hypothetical protein|nr:hypothetical protein [Phycisphaerae bacterium]
MTPRRLEQGDVTSGNSKGLGESTESGGAESGADKLTSGDYGPDLQRVIDVWPTLPETMRQHILAMVEASQVKN